MSKQTVEEAAIQYDTDTFGEPKKGESVSMTEHQASKFIIEAVKAGAAWQREQGIDWISVEDGLPQATEISSIADYSADVLTYYRGRLEFSKAAFLKNGEFIGFCGQAGFALTHWAYINTPKTDK